MAFLRLCLLVALNFAARSLQQSKNPITDFCRRWGHQTAQIDNKLYIDGGLVAYNSIGSNSLNYTNTFLLYSDLNSSTQDAGMPNQYSNLTKGGSVPSVSGGVLWADNLNKCFYLFGGEFQSNPADFSFWAYDTLLNQWNETKPSSNVQSIQRVSYGSGTTIGDLGMGYYYGGWMNNNTSPAWKGSPMASNSLIQYNFNTGTLNNGSGPDSTGRAEGSMVYLPAGDGGLLVHFGGVEDPYKNGSWIGANMSTIRILDISLGRWHVQTASGAIPPPRRQFCAGATNPNDHSSYNIYLYGGYNTDPQNVTGYDDAYILTLPSFTWIKVFPTDNSTTKYGHGGCSANVIRKDQMLIIGGWFPSVQDCDSVPAVGQHNMNLGYNGAQSTLWDKYDPKLSTYFVPTPVIAAIGGGPTGSATAKQPATWGDGDLSVLFTRTPSFSARTATRAIPTSTDKSSGSSSKSHVGAIAGGVVGGLAFLIIVLSLILFCLHRRKKNLKKGGKDGADHSAPPAELAATSPIHEMSSPGAAKYMSMHNSPDPGAHPAYTGASMHSRTPSDQHSQPYYQSTTPTTSAPYPSPYGTEYSHHNQQYQSDHYSSYSDNPNQPYDPYAPQHSPQHQRGSSYPTPTSPNYPPIAPQISNQQTYYPPPPEPSTHQRSARIGSPETSYSGDTEQQPHSTSNTPAHFYAQPVPRRGDQIMPPVPGLSPGGYGGEGTRGDVESSRGSVDSRRRPVKGRFVEVDHM